MLLSKLVYISMPLVLVNVLVNTIGAANTFYMFLGLVTLYGYHIHYKQEYEDIQDFITETSPTSPTSPTSTYMSICCICSHSLNACHFSRMPGGCRGAQWG